MRSCAVYKSSPNQGEVEQIHEVQNKSHRFAILMKRGGSNGVETGSEGQARAIQDLQPRMAGPRQVADGVSSEFKTRRHRSARVQKTTVGLIERSPRWRRIKCTNRKAGWANGGATQAGLAAKDGLNLRHQPSPDEIPHTHIT